MIEAFLKRCLLLDLETAPTGGSDETPRVLKIGAILGSDGKVFERKGRFRLDQTLQELGRLARRAGYVLGHNLLGHDLRVLRALAPAHPLLARPVVDTLYLSPLAFPENPYHHLVKDYKLVREAVNDPLADARLAARVVPRPVEELRRHGAPAAGLLCLLSREPGLGSSLPGSEATSGRDRRTSSTPSPAGRGWTPKRRASS